MAYRNQGSPPAAPDIRAPGVPELGMTTPGVPAPIPEVPDFTEYYESEQLALISSLRKIWIRLAIWSRSLIVSAAADLGDIQDITDRLTALPEAFSAVLNRYFEPGDADRFRGLPAEHISIMEALVTAEKNKDIQTVNRETVNLYKNAGRIGAYLNSINTYWDRKELSSLLYDYIEMLLADLVERLEGDYARELTIFEDLLTHAVKIADYTAQGMLRKFRP